MNFLCHNDLLPLTLKNNLGRKHSLNSKINVYLGENNNIKCKYYALYKIKYIKMSTHELIP